MMGEAPWGWSGPDHLTPFGTQGEEEGEKESNIHISNTDHLTPFGTQGEEEGETKKRKTRETVDKRCQMLCEGGSFLRVV
jgi:hypothetical protein